jgi:hypothetical protein
MQDRLIFPTSIEQIGTSELVHDNFPAAKWMNVSSEADGLIYVSDIDLDVSPYLFFEWALNTPSGAGAILYYCLNLSTQLLVEPHEWMLDIISRPKQLSDGTR